MQEETRTNETNENTSNNVNQNDEIERKIFVGGLPYFTTDENLVKYFSTFGDVENVMIMRDKFTDEPRGFAFVTFSDTSGAKKALNQSGHVLLGKKIETKKALPKGEISNQLRYKKLFVGGIDPTVNEDELLEYFSKFGKVKLAQIIKDKATGRSRNFGFVTLEDMDAVHNALEHKPHILKDKEMEVKPAEPKRYKLSNFNPYIYGQQLYYVHPNSPFDYYNYMMSYMDQESYGFFPYIADNNNLNHNVDILTKDFNDKLNL